MIGAVSVFSFYLSFLNLTIALETKDLRNAATVSMMWPRLSFGLLAAIRVGWRRTS